MPGQRLTMTGEEALAELSSVQGLHRALEMRASGLTWLIWGVAVAGIFMTYNFLGVLSSNVAELPGAVFAVAWAPWVAIGVVATTLLWRSIGLVVPSEVGRRELIFGVVLFLLFIPGGIYVLYFVEASWVEPAVALAVAGGVYMVVGAIGWMCSGAFERWTWLVVGALYAATSITISLLLTGDPDAAYAVFSFLAPGLVLVAQTTAGLLVALRA